MLSRWRKASIALGLPLVLAAACSGWVPSHESADSSTAAPPQEGTSPPERIASKKAQVAAPLPPEDAPGKDVPDLPRYPDSVRVEYERSQLDALILTRVRYLSDEKVDTVRGFYRGVFQSEGWRVANAEFSDGEWTFLAVKGDREADIEVSPHDAGVETDMRLSQPQPSPQPEEEDDDSSEASPPERDAGRREAAPPRTPAPAPPAPAPTAPATATATSTAAATVPPVSGGYGYDDDDGGLYEDDD